MDKTLLIYVLYFVNVSTMLETEFIMFPGLAIISTMFIFIDFIYVCMHKVSKTLVYNLPDLCTIYRSISCAIFSVLVTILGILLTNILHTFNSLYHAEVCLIIFNI